MDTCRFRHASVTIAPRLLPIEPRQLVIQVFELEHVSLLGDPLTEVERAAVKFSDWCRNFPHQTEDLVINLEIDESEEYPALKGETTGSANAHLTNLQTHSELNFSSTQTRPTSFALTRFSSRPALGPIFFPGG